MVIKKKTTIKKNIHDVWKVLGHDFAHPYKWASAVNHSEGKGTPMASTQCDERACQTAMGNIREKLTQYSDSDFHLAYTVTEGMPGMVKTATNSWKLSKSDEQNTHLQIQMEFIFQGLMGTLMLPFMKLKLNALANHMIEDFAFYTENGKPHPRKIKAMTKVKHKKSS
jgi:Polyketide cyclase / dehydrase and lipid transport